MIFLIPIHFGILIQDIYNLDESSLFFAQTKNASLVTNLEQQDKNARGIQQEKQRITVLCGASMAGEKLPLVIIGHNANPCGFKGARLPVEYYSIKKTWMNSKLFNEIL